MKKILLFLISFLLINQAYATCKYETELNQCLESTKNSQDPNLWFICKKWKLQWEIYSQIVLDIEFRKIDKEVENYILQLEADKDRFFGEEATETVFDAVDEIEDKFSTDWVFAKKYLDLCWTWDQAVITEVLSCMWSVKKTDILKYFPDSICRELVDTKLSINRDISYNILKLNKYQVSRDSKKTFQQKVRSSFDKLFNLIKLNIWYLSRIAQSWLVKTPKLANKS